MTEEEKKVFMKIKDRHEYFTRDDIFEETNDFEKECLFEIGYLTQIIEKLQKENEELKEQKEIDMYLIGDSISKEIVKRDYIPKDKIREYIKEKEEEKEGVKNISLEEYAITSKELKESEICLLKCILEEK